MKNEKDLKDLLTRMLDNENIYMIGTDTPESKPDAEIIVAYNTPCKDCGQILSPVTLHLHQQDRETLEWLMQDRKKDAGSIIRHLIQLEGSKRRIAAAKRVRPRKT